MVNTGGARLPRSTSPGSGELCGAALTARQVRQITVRIEQLAPGVLRVSHQDTQTGGLARTAPELARLVASAFREAQVHAYSTWRGHVYDGLDPESPRAYRRPKPPIPGRRVDVHDPREWRLDVDGRWVAPGSHRRWRPDSQTVQRVMARRQQLGLPPTPDPVADGGRGLLGDRSG